MNKHDTVNLKQWTEATNKVKILEYNLKRCEYLVIALYVVVVALGAFAVALICVGDFS